MLVVVGDTGFEPVSASVSVIPGTQDTAAVSVNDRHCLADPRRSGVALPGMRSSASTRILLT
jgi:hypothetical protein